MATDQATKERRLRDLQRASEESVQSQLEQEALFNSMTDEELADFINNDSECPFVVVDDNGVNGGELTMDLRAKYDNSQEIFFDPTATLDELRRESLNQQPNMMGCYQQYNQYNQQGYTDPRIIMYNNNPGMQMYGINPTIFVDEAHLMKYFERMEEDRRKQCGLAVLIRNIMVTCGDLTRAEADEEIEKLKFKPANDIVREQAEAQRKENERLAAEANAKLNEYNSYDNRGIRRRKTLNCTYKTSTGIHKASDVDKKYKYDEEKECWYKEVTREDDYKEANELRNFYNELERGRRIDEAIRNIGIKDYQERMQFYAEAKAQGMSPGLASFEYQYKDVDFKKIEKGIFRALRMADYSKDKFREILNQCCNTNIDYSNRSEFFCCDYDMARDLHFASLMETPEELAMNSLVTQRLKDEYGLKRNLFLTKISEGRFEGPTRIDQYRIPCTPKPRIDELTLEDFNNPENHIMYTKMIKPELSTGDNMFIPNFVTDDNTGNTNNTSNPNIDRETIEFLKSQGVNIDDDGNIRPLERTIGFGTKDENGNVIYNEEFNVPITENDILNNHYVDIDDGITIEYF